MSKPAWMNRGTWLNLQAGRGVYIPPQHREKLEAQGLQPHPVYPHLHWIPTEDHALPDRAAQRDQMIVDKDLNEWRGLFRVVSPE